MSKPDDALEELSRFTGAAVSAAEIRNEARQSRRRRSRGAAGARGARGVHGIPGPLGAGDAAQVEKVAGEELRRLGYCS